MNGTNRRLAQIAGLLILIAAALPRDAASQPVLNFKRAIVNWPTIELYFSSGCNGVPAYFTDKQYFRVVENGVEVRDFTLWCPDPTARAQISVALAFDAGGVMYGDANTGAKAAGNAFVDMMDGVTDEASVLWFNQTVQTAQGMTTNKASLHDAVNMLPANGPSAVWDGVYAGVLELINNGVNQSRAVIALTCGYDNASSRQKSEIIALANRNRIRVFTIGYGGMVDQASLEDLALKTGGRFYLTPNPADIVAIYQEISTIIFQGFQECLITYTSACMDGSVRTVDLTLANFCGGADLKTKTYKAPRDTSTFVPLRFALGAVTAAADTTVALPLLLLDTIPAGTLLRPAAFTVLFDSLRAQYTGVAVPPASPLAGVPITVAPVPGGMRFATVTDKFLAAPQPPGVLAELTFRTGRPAGVDTLRCPLLLSDWTFAAGCYRAVTSDGEIIITPQHTNAVGSPDASSASRIALFPDPSSGAMTLRIPSQPGEAVHIRVHDLLGRTLLEREETSASDLHQSTLSLLPAPPGTYLVSISSGARRWTRTLRLY
jgi:hypothetical protein